MADPVDLTCDEVVKFLKNRGGATTNLELVSYFRKLLNDPLNQVEMRLRFKDIINSIANVYEEQGTKCISLKEKYLESQTCESKPSSYEMQTERHVRLPAESPTQSYQPYWRYRLSCNTKLVPPTPSLSFSSLSPEASDCRRFSFGSENSPVTRELLLSPNADITPLISGRSREKRRAGVFDTVWLDQKENDMQMQNGLLEPRNGTSQVNDRQKFDAGRRCSYESSYQSLEYVNLCNEIGLPSASNVQPSNRRLSLDTSLNSSYVHKPNQQTFHRNLDVRQHDDDDIPNHPPSPLPPRKMSEKKSSAEEIKPIIPNPQSEQHSPVKEDSETPEDEYRTHSKSVKERAQQIEKMSAQESAPPRRGLIHTGGKSRDFRNEKISDDDTSVVSTLDSKLRRQWFVKAAQSDYHGLLSLLKIEPRLAGLRDITSGFTALHWAAKHGNAEVVKLIAGVHKVSPDVKSHGGYTCIHLATLYKHKQIVELLVKTYGADPTIRDNSGKRADQYPSDYLTVSAGANRQIACNRHYKSIAIPVNHKLIRVRPPPEPSSGTFIRIGSLNLKVSMAAPGFGSVKGRRIQRLKTWGSADSVAESWSSSHTNDRMSFRRKKKAKKKNSELQHRGSISSKHDSDSDGAYGFHS